MGEPEIANLGFVVLIHALSCLEQDVLQFNIVVDETLTVDVLESF